MSIFNSQWASTIVELPTLTFHHALLPLSIFSALHGIRIAMIYRQSIEQAAEQSLKDGVNIKARRVPLGQAWLSVLAIALGGGFTSSMLLGMPPTWLGSNIVVPTYTLSVFLIQCTPLYDILMEYVPPGVRDTVLLLADGSLRALSIAKIGVEGSRMRFAADSHQGGAGGGLNEPWVAMLGLGMIAGAGGGMWADILRLKSQEWSLATPAFTHAATYDMKAALLCAFFYASSTSPQFYSVLRGISDDALLPKSGLLESQDAKAMTMLIMCTLLLGNRAEPTIYRMTGLSLSPQRWVTSISAQLTGNSKEEEKDSVRTRGRQQSVETAEEEEEEEDESSKKSSRGRRKASTPKRITSPGPVETTITRNSTRIRKSTRKDL
ncbi:hypothetical protein BGZ76_007958 [Entomortierella beljakovae]|nr:hypothetical protein BGZ76_007958 [Entomortierella beljakovae]